MQLRVVSLAAVVALVFLVLVARLWYLQVLTGQDYTRSAEATKAREVKIPAQRGVIYDRDGEVLANNVPGLNVTVVPAYVSREKLANLAGVLEADEDAVLARYDAATAEATRNLYEPILVKENADRDDVTYVSERAERFPGLAVNDDYVRNYPGGDLAAHVIGYTGAVTRADLDSGSFEGLTTDSIIGKSGAELVYEDALSGRPGKKVYDVDALGRVVPQGAQLDARGRFVDENGADEDGVDPRRALPSSVTEPVPGDDLKLTIDMDLQKRAEAELNAAIERAKEEGATGEGGAAIAMDPDNGEILAMAAEPDFEPQLFVGGVSGAEEVRKYEYLNSERANSPFTNRAIAGAYPAASTFKAFTALAGLAYGAITPHTTFTDTGACWRPAGVTMGCWQSWREYNDTGTTHGTQNVVEALMDSNDKFFYQVADWMWNQTGDENLLPKFYERFGFGEATGVDLPGEMPGRVPTSQWQEEFGQTAEDRYWSVGRWVNMAIGQGDLAVTPLQLTRAYAAIENGGTLVTPHVGMEVRDQSGKVVKEITPEPEKKIDLNAQDLDIVRRGLRLVTTPSGTAGPAFVGSKLSVIGKSGTGEMSGGDPVNWFVGWAGNRQDPIVVLVMVERGAHSEETAAPAVRGILEEYHGIERSGSERPESGADSPEASPAGIPRAVPGPTRAYRRRDRVV